MSIQRGEIYFVDLNPTKGREQTGQRPVLVLSTDAINRLPLVAMERIENAVRFALGL
jgi:mRNA interferase MazF